MAEPTPEQQKLIAEAVKASQEKLKADTTVEVIVTGGGVVTVSNPRFKIIKKD